MEQGAQPIGATSASSVEAARSEVWRGHLPTVFTLAPDEVATVHQPRAFAACLPRQTLLPFVCDAVRRHFEPFGPPMGGKLWFAHEGTPLRWQLPVGVLFDLLVGEEADEGALPWNITVHFQSFPSGTLLQQDANAREAERVLMNTLKEACYLRCGSALAVNSLSPANQQRLAASLASGDHPAYLEAFSAVSEAIAKSGRPRALPVRIYTAPDSWRQLPLPPTRIDGSPATLLDALREALPSVFGEAAAPLAPAPAVRGSAEAAGGGAASSSEASAESEKGAVQGGGERSAGEGESRALVGAAGAGCRVLVQGVRVPLGTSLDWLSSACAHPDGWLHVSVQPNG